MNTLTMFSIADHNACTGVTYFSIFKPLRHVRILSNDDKLVKQADGMISPLLQNI